MSEGSKQESVEALSHRLTEVERHLSLATAALVELYGTASALLAIVPNSERSDYGTSLENAGFALEKLVRVEKQNG